MGHDLKLRLVNIIERYKKFKAFLNFFKKNGLKGVNDFEYRVVNIIEGIFFERHYSSLTKKNMLVSGVVLLKSKLLKQSNISNKKECHPLPTPILFINIIFNYSLLVREEKKI